MRAPATPLRARQRFQILDRDAHAGARRTLRVATGVVFRVRRSGDIEMSPGWTIDELLQENRGSDRSAPTPARVLHICPLAADQILVLVPGRHPPEALTDALPSLNQLPSQLIIVREKAGGLTR